MLEDTGNAMIFSPVLAVGALSSRSVLQHVFPKTSALGDGLPCDRKTFAFKLRKAHLQLVRQRTGLPRLRLVGFARALKLPER